MPKMIAKIAKRFLTGSFLLGAVVLAPKDGCDRIRVISPDRTLAGLGDDVEAQEYGGPDAVIYNPNPILKPVDF